MHSGFSAQTELGVVSPDNGDSGGSKTNRLDCVNPTANQVNKYL